MLSHNVLAVTDARETQRARIPKRDPLQAAKRQPPSYRTPAHFVKASAGCA